MRRSELVGWESQLIENKKIKNQRKRARRWGQQLKKRQNKKTGEAGSAVGTTARAGYETTAEGAGNVAAVAKEGTVRVCVCASVCVSLSLCN
jgi:hypothetical protein